MQGTPASVAHKALAGLALVAFGAALLAARDYVPEHSGRALAVHLATLALLAGLGLQLAAMRAFSRAEQRLHHLAMFDPLTELFNRRAFMDLAEREVARSRRERRPYAVLMMDLDHFKAVNDRFGHLAGDRVLKAFGAVARQNLRAPDIVGRYGGEEFCALLPGVRLKEALVVAQRLRDAVAAALLGGLPQPTTVSIGVTESGGGPAAALNAAIARADEALYRAKRAGRSRVVGIEPTPQRRKRFQAPDQATPAAPAASAPPRSGSASGARRA